MFKFLMPKPQFEFKADKSLAVTSYLAKGDSDMYTILKMIYVADRLHLERYGRTITGDKFAALKEGACPSRIYDSFKALRGDPKNKKNYLPESEKFLTVDGEKHAVTVKQMPPLDVLSGTDMDCLDEVLTILKQPNGRWTIIGMAHDSAWEKTGRNSIMNIFDIAKESKGGDALLKHLEAKFS